MNIAILQREFTETQDSPTLFDKHNFRARKEALDFVRVIEAICAEDQPMNSELVRLEEEAKALGECLKMLNISIAQDWRTRLKIDHPAPEELRFWLAPYTDYAAQQWGKSHYGYENLDLLLDEVLLPQPHPQANLTPERGMVRYQPTPASVILELTERIPFTARDVFYDLGSGLGKVTALVHLLTGVRCVGVEYQPDFCTYARQQADALALEGIAYLNADARNAVYADGTVFFLFNPFGGDIFPAVLERLRMEAQQHPLWICSYGSSSQPLSELAWLKRIPPSSMDEAALAVFQGKA